MLCMESVDMLEHKIIGSFYVLPESRGNGLEKILTPDGKAVFACFSDSKLTGVIQTIFPSGTFELKRN